MTESDHFYALKLPLIMESFNESLPPQPLLFLQPDSTKRIDIVNEKKSFYFGID